VDAIIYTTHDLPEMETIPPHQTQHILHPRALEAEPVSKVPGIIGITCGCVVFIIFCFIAWLLHKKARERNMQFTWKAPVPPLSQSRMEGHRADSGDTSISKGDLQTDSYSGSGSNSNYASPTANPRHYNQYNPQLVPTLEEPEPSHASHHSPPLSPSRGRSNTVRSHPYSEQEQYEEVRLPSSPNVPYRVPAASPYGSPEPQGSVLGYSPTVRSSQSQRPAQPPPAVHRSRSGQQQYISTQRLEPLRRSPVY